MTIFRVPIQETRQQDPPLGPGETSVIAELVYESWRGRWTGTYSKEDGLSVGVEELNPSMEGSIHRQCSLDLHSRDDDGFPFVHCEFDTSHTGGMGSSLYLLLKKHGPSLELTKTEKERCRDVIGESEGEEGE